MRMVEEVVEGAEETAEADQLTVAEVMMLDGVLDKKKILYSLVTLE